MLVDLTVKEFLNKVAGSDPVPGGGSIAALNLSLIHISEWCRSFGTCRYGC